MSILPVVEASIKRALKGQYRASLAMLRETIEKCPDEVWTGGVHPRSFWRIAYHALFYTHLYAMPREEDFVAWEKHRDCSDLWGDPPMLDAFTQEELVAYADHIDANIEAWVDALDLESTESGFSWYQDFPKLDHQLLNIRHLGVHTGQLSEVLMREGIQDLKWSSRVPR